MLLIKAEIESRKVEDYSYVDISLLLFGFPKKNDWFVPVVGKSIGKRERKPVFGSLEVWQLGSLEVINV